MNILVYGYGNPARQDDALGVLLAERLQGEFGDEVELDSNYQLNAEDSLLISEKDYSVFVDASEDAEAEPFRFKKLSPAAEIGFSTHAMDPSSILGLCHELYAKKPDVYLLEIKGYEWGFKEGLSVKAAANLEKATAFLKEKITEQISG
ncbi:MAG: hydrogenase maturation protease [Fibrobacterota bacterium]